MAKRKYRDVMERLLANSVMEDENHPELGSPCWIFIGSISNRGYGRLTFRVEGRLTTKLAHRTAYEEFTGRKLKSSEQIDHLCRVPHCINPMHMEIVSIQENLRRAWELKRR